MPAVQFETGRAYKNSYFLFIDAAGYSTVVVSNPLDRAGQAFDLLLERAVNRVGRIAESHRCERAELWSWRGDGGFFVIHDDNESVARDVALETGKSLVRLDLRHLQDALVLYSPYLAYTRPSPVQMERGDMPHYLVSAPAGQVFEKIRGLVQSYCAPESLYRVL